MVNSFHEYIIGEPIIFFALFGFEIANFAIPNLYLQKACRNDTSSAPDLNTPCDDERRGSDYVTSVYNSFLWPGAIVSLIVILFASPYSDATKKRRMFIVAALIGLQLKVLVSIAQTIFWSWSPTTGVILGCGVDRVFGSRNGLSAFMYAYVYDRTSKENRLTRLALLVMAESAGTLLGQGSAGLLLRRFGFLITFLVSFVLYTLAIVSAFFFVREKTATAGQKVDFKFVFDVKRIQETFALVVQPQKPRKHVIAIWLLLFIDLIVYFSFSGEKYIIYLYFRNHFHWDEEKFSLFSSYRNLSVALGGTLCSLVMSKWLKIHDGIIGTFATFWDTCAAIGFYYAREEWQIYLVPLLDIFHGLALSICFSQLSKFFTEHEFARLNSVTAIFLTMGLSGVPIYSTLYRNRSDAHPNAFFLLSAFLSLLICTLYSITYFLSRDARITDEKNEAQTTGSENYELQ